MMAATLAGNVEIVKFLLQKGADPEIGEKQGYTPMHGAAFQGRADVTRALIQAQLNPSHMHEDGFRPIHRACWGKEPRHTDTVAVLIEGGVKPTEAAKDGSTPLSMAEAAGNQGTIVLLQEAIRKAAAEDQRPITDDEI